MNKKVFALFLLSSLSKTASAFVVQNKQQQKQHSINHGIIGFGESTSLYLSKSRAEENIASFPSNEERKNKNGSARTSRNSMGLFAASFIVLSNFFSLLIATQPAFAAESRQIGEIRGSGLVFKDTLNIEAFEDPKVRGVTLYISNFQRPLTERLQKDFFSDPSQAALGCAKTGEVSIADNIAVGKGGEEVFEEKKSLLFKELKVQRIYDQDKNTMVYVSFNTRLDKNDDTNKSRFKSSICAVNLD